MVFQNGLETKTNLQSYNTRTGFMASRQGPTHTGIRAAAHPENLTDDLGSQEPARSKVLTRHLTKSSISSASHFLLSRCILSLIDGTRPREEKKTKKKHTSNMPAVL